MKRQDNPRPNFADRLRAAARRFVDAPGGATAVEFAMVSMPFLLLMMGTFELGLIFLLSTTLDNSLSDAARQIRTGQLQTGSTPSTAASFRTTVCNGLGWLSSQCDANLRLDVQSFTSFSNVNLPPPMNGTAYDPTKLNGYQDTAPCAIVVVRAYYKWTLVVPGMDQALKQLPDGTKLISSTVSFKNEPFTSTTQTSMC